MQLHIPEAKVSLSADEKIVYIIGSTGTITLSGIYAEKFKANYATHFDSSIMVDAWEHPTVTLDLTLKEFAVTHR